MKSEKKKSKEKKKKVLLSPGVPFNIIGQELSNVQILSQWTVFAHIKGLVGGKNAFWYPA